MKQGLDSEAGTTPEPRNLERVIPGSALGKAIGCTSVLWPGLVRFLGDPKIPLDTARRAIRNPGTATLPRDLE